MELKAAIGTYYRLSYFKLFYVHIPSWFYLGMYMCSGILNTYIVDKAKDAFWIKVTQKYMYLQKQNLYTNMIFQNNTIPMLFFTPCKFTLPLLMKPIRQLTAQPTYPKMCILISSFCKNHSTSKFTQSKKYRQKHKHLLHEKRFYFQNSLMYW